MKRSLYLAYLIARYKPFRERVGLGIIYGDHYVNYVDYESQDQQVNVGRITRRILKGFYELEKARPPKPPPFQGTQQLKGKEERTID